ncbi:MAG: hypothetical protein AAF701_10200, partial [Pseudomonadota bacterium]
TLQAMISGANAPKRSQVLTDILGGPGAQRVILSNKNFICVPNRIFEGGELYGLAEAKLAALDELFEPDEIEIHMAIRDPATFVPAAFAQTTGRSFDTFFKGVDLDNLYWSDLIDRMLETIPGAKITVWCNEDTPFIWPHILRNLGGFDETQRVAGGYDLMAQVLTEEGVGKLKGYLKANPPKSEAQRQKILLAFLERFALDDAVQDEVDIPSWSEDIMESLSEAYDEDVSEIAARDDITFIEAKI